VQLLPPPDGVIVLKPGKVREQAEACPEGFEEVEGYGGWRFCVDPHNPEPIPPLWSPPIAGIPFEEAEKILARHQQALIRLSGVGGVGLGSEGIEVEADDPAAVPSNVEGLPIKILLRKRQKVSYQLRHGSVCRAFWRECGPASRFWRFNHQSQLIAWLKEEASSNHL
jgi:hypothetical protein